MERICVPSRGIRVAGSLEVKKQNNKLGELKKIHSSYTKKKRMTRKGELNGHARGKILSQEKTY